MNSRSDLRINLAVYFAAAIGAFLIVAGLVWVLYSRTRPAGLNQVRIEERIKNLREIRTTSAQALNTYGWKDQPKGVVRLPITNAMDLIIREWKEPAAGRSNLLARLERANPPPPPPEPAQPSIFE
jgi:hypothetical protein